LVVVVQHEPGEGLGTLAAHLPEVRLARTFAGDEVPRDPQDGLVVLGGGMGVYQLDRLPHLRSEIELLRRALDQGVPVLGICLGAQLLAAALGGEVAKAPHKEIGFYRVRVEAREDALFAGAPDDFVAFHWHGDAFTLPGGATALASSTMTPVQAFRHGERAWGIQFHLEVEENVLAAMLSSGADELAAEGVDPDLLLAQSARELPRLREVAAGVFSRWAALL
jgi:GMP synthase (glutamine-hydrolysing)